MLFAMLSRVMMTKWGARRRCQGSFKNTIPTFQGLSSGKNIVLTGILELLTGLGLLKIEEDVGDLGASCFL
jgi:hypothetical protein